MVVKSIFLAQLKYDYSYYLFIMSDIVDLMSHIKRSVCECFLFYKKLFINLPDFSINKTHMFY